MITCSDSASGDVNREVTITSCGYDIVAEETTDPTNALGATGQRAKPNHAHCSPCICIAEGTEFEREAICWKPSPSTINSGAGTEERRKGPQDPVE